MAAASPVPALADRLTELRDEVARRCAKLHGCEAPAARSELANLREALRLMALADDRLRMCGVLAVAVERPRVPRIEDGTDRDPRCGGRPHP